MILELLLFGNHQNEKEAIECLIQRNKKHIQFQLKKQGARDQELIQHLFFRSLSIFIQNVRLRKFQLQEGKDIGAYLHIVARNLLASWQRSQLRDGKERKTDVAVDFQDEQVQQSFMKFATDFGKYGVALKDVFQTNFEKVILMKNLIQQLKLDCRLLLQAHYYEGMSLKEYIQKKVVLWQKDKAQLALSKIMDNDLSKQEILRLLEEAHKSIKRKKQLQKADKCQVILEGFQKKNDIKVLKENVQALHNSLFKTVYDRIQQHKRCIGHLRSLFFKDEKKQ